MYGWIFYRDCNQAFIVLLFTLECMYRQHVTSYHCDWPTQPHNRKSLREGHHWRAGKVSQFGMSFEFLSHWSNTVLSQSLFLSACNLRWIVGAVCVRESCNAFLWVVLCGPVERQGEYTPALLVLPK